MKTEILSVLANGKRMGKVTYENNTLHFSYAPSWQESGLSYPLSLSMPLAQDEHSHAVVEAYLWGLLPDNDDILKQYGRQFQVSPRNVFRLLQHLGEDCAGAIQFVAPSREGHIINNYKSDQSRFIEWLTEDELNKLISEIKKNSSIQRIDSDQGHFSLAGAQPKTALYRCPRTHRWGIPKGITPTTHILKPAISEFKGIAQNEHFCLLLATELGLNVAKSEVIQCGDIPVIVLERYDRMELEGQFYRVHQEDLCQARGVPPHSKYQADGGPSVKDIAETIWGSSSQAYDDICTLADTLILNFLIMGTDAHAKNYSILHYRGGSQLTPLYDIVSALPYPNISNIHKSKMAMKIGSSYYFKKIQATHWNDCAKELNLKPKYILERIQQISSELPEACEEVSKKMQQQGITHPVTELLCEGILKRTEEALELYSLV